MATQTVERNILVLPTLEMKTTYSVAPLLVPMRKDGFLTWIGNGVVAFYDWLSGPAMTEQERIQSQITAAEQERRGLFL
jgi:hypothetical protein